MRGLGRFLWAAAALCLALPEAASATFAGSTVLVSRPTGVGPVPPAFDGASRTPGALSADGRYAAFESDAEGFAPGTNPLVQHYIYLRDTQAGTTTLVSRSDGFNGVSANENSATPVVAVAPAGVMQTAPLNVPHVLVLFTTNADNLLDHATGTIPSFGNTYHGTYEAWLRDVTAGTTTLVSRDVDGSPLPGGGVNGASLDVANPGGPLVAFGKYSGDGGIYLRTVNASSTVLISCQSNSCGSMPTATYGFNPAVRFVPGSINEVEVAFDTHDMTMTGDPDNHEQVMMATELAPMSATGPSSEPIAFRRVSQVNSSTPGNSNSSAPSFDSDGNAVAFLSSASNLTGDSVPAGVVEAYSHALLTTGANTLLSRASASSGGAPVNQSVGSVSLGGDASHLRAVFDGTPTNLPHTLNDTIYVRDVDTNTTALIDRANGASGQPGSNGAQGHPSISENGLVALFGDYGDGLTPQGGTTFERVYERTLPASAAGSGSLVLVSRPGGTGPFQALTASSFDGFASADGRYVAFSSYSASLLPAGRSGNDQVFVRDLLTHRTILVSRASGVNGAVSNQEADVQGISADGRRVIFISDASNLSPGAPKGVYEAYVRDLVTNTTTLVSRATGAAGKPSATDIEPDGISADGNAVWMESGSALDPLGAGGKYHVYLRNLKTGTTTLVDRDTGVAGAVPQVDVSGASIDADGGRVAFDTTAALAGAPNDNHDHVYVRDLKAGTTTLVSRLDGPAGVSANGDSGSEAIDAKGDVVAFSSSAANLGAFRNLVFVRNLNSGHTMLVSRQSGATGATFNSGEFPSIDAAGDRVAFSGTLTYNPFTPETPEIYLRDLRAQTTILASVANGSAGAPADGSGSTQSAVSANGNCVAFTATSTNLGDGFASGHFESVHMRVLRGECPISPPHVLITRGPRKTTTNRTPTFSFRANERRVTFQCRLDTGMYKPCTSPFTTPKLAFGPHRFEVRAVDQAGYVGRPTILRFTVRKRRRRQR